MLWYVLVYWGLSIEFGRLYYNFLQCVSECTEALYSIVQLTRRPQEKEPSYDELRILQHTCYWQVGPVRRQPCWGIRCKLFVVVVSFQLLGACSIPCCRATQSNGRAAEEYWHADIEDESWTACSIQCCGGYKSKCTIAVADWLEEQALAVVNMNFCNAPLKYEPENAHCARA